MVQLFNKITQRDVQVLLKIIPAKISSSFIYYQVQEEFDDNQQAYLLIKVRDKLINAPEYFINGWEEFSKYLYETFGISLDELITLQKKDDLKTKFLKRKASVKPTITKISLNKIQQKWADETFSKLDIKDDIKIYGYLFNCWPRKLGDGTNGLYYGDYEIGIVETRIHTFSEDYFKEVMVHELAHFTTYKYCDDYESHGATFLREQYRLDLMVFDKEKTQKILEKDIYRYTFQIPDANLEHIEFYANEHNYTTLNQFTVIEKIKAVQELITVSEKSLSYVANKNANQPWSFFNFQLKKIKELKNKLAKYQQTHDKIKNKQIDIISTSTIRTLF